MSRRISALGALVVIGFALAATACSSNSATGPSPVRADQTCTNWASNGTCLH
ncbi:MAG TPA: hypothetical protein VFP39_00055 [Gemmatimonadales bacterium]|nr:hypothetical protein [Gemmatimonadales bacterium]